MNTITYIEIVKFISPIIIGILLNQLTVPEQLLYQWEQVFFYQNAFSFAYLWAMSQIQLTLIPADASYRSALSMSNILIALLLASMVVISMGATTNSMELNIIIFLFSFFLVNGQPIEYHFYSIHQYTKVTLSVSGTHIIGLLYVLIIYYFFLDAQPLQLALTGLMLLHGLRTFFWWQIAPPIGSLRHFIRLIRHTFPLWGSYLLSGGALYVDGWLVERYLDADFFLYFRYGAREFPLNTIIASGISASIAFHIAKEGIHHEKTNQWIRNKIKRFQWIVFPLSIVLLCSSNLLFKWFYQDRYSDSALFFDGFLLLTASRVIFSQSYMLALCLHKNMFVVTVLEFLIHIFMSTLLIPFYGWRAIVISTICAYLFEKIAYIYLLRKEGINYWKIHPVKEFIWGVCLLGITYVLKYIIIS
jgi:hypothetical protein